MKITTNNSITIRRVKIYQRGKKKTYIADFWDNGQHRRVSFKTTNQKTARERAIKLEAQLLDGTFAAAPEPVCVQTSIDNYLEYLRTEGRRPKTVTKYKGFLGVFASFCADTNICNLGQIKPTIIDPFRALRKVNHSVKSLHNEGVMLKGFLRWCKGRGLMATNPMENMQFKLPPLKPRGGPSLAEIDRILDSASGQRLTMLATLAFTGMRVGELQRLQPDDVDLTGGWLHVVSREGGETKTGYSRKVPIHARLRLLLTAMPKRKRPWYFTATPSRKYPEGNHWISTKRLNEDLLKFLTKLELPVGRKTGYTIHSLRHSFETTCVNGGIPQRVIDTWIGHRSDRSMAAHYYKLADEESQRIMTQVPFGTDEPAADAGGKEA